MNKTKIICTIGPASRDPQILRRLMDAGMNVCRLNFSHGTQDEHGALIKEEELRPKPSVMSLFFRIWPGPRSGPGRWPPVRSRCKRGRPSA